MVCSPPVVSKCLGEAHRRLELLHYLDYLDYIRSFFFSNTVGKGLSQIVFPTVSVIMTLSPDPPPPPPPPLASRLFYHINCNNGLYSIHSHTLAYTPFQSLWAAFKTSPLESAQTSIPLEIFFIIGCAYTLDGTTFPKSVSCFAMIATIQKRMPW